jgi:hypothetical protein
MSSELNQILDLRNVQDDVRRGYLFEQALREFVPWDFRPPLAVVARGEQLDAFYEWNSWHFIVEAKANRLPITRGMHEWEDFELKVRRRHGSCVGIFASLFPVAQGVFEAAEELNRGGHPCVVLAGDFWDDLRSTWIPIGDLLRYLVLHAKATHKAAPPKLQEVKRWCSDHKQIGERIQSTTRALSATFLRRHALPKHSQFYVTRSIDKALRDATALLKPSQLERDVRVRKKRKRGPTNAGGTIEYTAARTPPTQVYVLRDASGAGKTTLSVQIALTASPYYGIARAAAELDIDSTLATLKQLGPSHGLHSLVELDRPIICAIDSLDEATNIPSKRAEVLGLLRYLNELNMEAAAIGLLAYPILLLFTVREDYWIYWQSALEGVRTQYYRNHFSLFGASEFADALEKYSSAYQFVRLNAPNELAAQALSLPFNIHVFSEANEYSEGVSFADVFDERVLQLYFERKRDNVVRRRIPLLTGETFLNICASCAMFALRKRQRTVARDEVVSVLKDGFPQLRSESEQIVLSMVSEGIVVRDPDNSSRFQFRHSRFMEYLVARHIVRSFKDGEGSIADLTGEVYRAGVVSMFRVHDFVRFICEKEHPDIYDRLMSIYAQSDAYMTAKLTRLRTDIAFGVAAAPHELELVQKSINSLAQQVAWNVFFVVAAKTSDVAEASIWEAFEAAWRASSGSSDRWKLLDRLFTRGLLLSGKVLERILESRVPREWEHCLGCILSDRLLRARWTAEFTDVADHVQEALDRRAGIQWHHVHHLWETLRSGKDYVPGVM